ncbi:hypothetical protein TNCT_341771, partial [Trichonephila clavata]
MADILARAAFSSMKNQWNLWMER